MNQSTSIFFIALLPPQEVQTKANEIKQHFAEVYNSSAAQKSPPHITLQPPFEWETSKFKQLEEFLQEFASNNFPIPIILDGFGAFSHSVIYINVIKTAELMMVQEKLMNELESSFGIVDRASEKRSFSPHLTVAFRDLKRENFSKAWDKFKNKSLKYNLVVPQLTLLIHNNKCWEICQEFSFNILSDNLQ